jgi:large subunit ribosomal protein L40e
MIDPTLFELAKSYRTDKKVCRVCYARLHKYAHNCRKRGCHSTQLRTKKLIKL